MNGSIAPVPRSHRQLRFGVIAVVASATVATLIATGVAEPYPDLRMAYLICVAVAVFGLVQLIVGIAGLKRS